MKVVLVKLILAATLIGLVPNYAWSDVLDPEQGQSGEIEGAESSGAARARAISKIVAQNRESRAVEASGEATKEPESGLSFLKMLEALGIVVGLFLVAMHFYKKHAGKAEIRNGRRVRIIEKTQITGKAALILVEVEGRKVLVGTGSDSVTMTPLEPLDLSDIEDQLKQFENTLDEPCPDVTKLSA